jgi:hypothetical protein
MTGGVPAPILRRSHGATGHANRQCDPRPVGRERGVSHHVTAERLNERDARILASPTAVEAQLIVRLGLQCNAQSLDPNWIARFVEQHPGNADAGEVSPRDQPREQIQVPVGTPYGCGIQRAFDFERVPRFRLHQYSKAL